MTQSTPSYWQKSGEKLKLAENLSWNFPEQKSGSLTIIGGNSSSFATEVKLADFSLQLFPFLLEIKNLFPDALKSQFPPLPNLTFCPSTESGSFAKSAELRSALNSSSATPNFALFSGDFSKNSATAIAISELIIASPQVPILLTRDTVDLVLSDAASFIERDNLFIVASLAQLQKLFRAVYYPKMLLLSQPLLPVVETLHKFTLSYPLTLLTFHEGEILCAKDGSIISITLDKTPYSPLSLWNGEIAAKIAIFSMFNPNKPLESTVAGLTYR